MSMSIPSPQLQPDLQLDRQPASQARPTASPAPEPAAALSLPTGETARVHDGAIEIYDRRERLIVRYDGDSAEIVAPGGDLTLAAPDGDVVIRSGNEVKLQGERLDMSAADSTLTSQRVTILAGRLSTTARTLTQQVERFELAAGEIVERTRDAFREASGLVQTRAARMRTLVDKSFDVFSERTSLVSKKDTSIDGEKILLG